MAHIRKFHAEQNLRDGTTYPLTRIFNADGTLTQNVPVALVGEESGAMEPSQALYCERTAELMFAGCDPKATAFAMREAEALATVLRWQGYRQLHCFVPLPWLDSIRKPLERAKFTYQSDRLAHFMKDLGE